MDALRFTATTVLDAPVDRLWRFHLRPDALEMLSPPLLPTAIVEPGDGVAEGSEIVLEIGFWPVKIRWRALHSSVREGVGFVDVALESPFPYWVHQHRFEDEGEGRSRLTDTVWYLPPGWLPDWIARPAVTISLRLLFWWRHRQTRRAVVSPPEDRPTTIRLPADSSTGG